MLTKESGIMVGQDSTVDPYSGFEEGPQGAVEGEEDDIVHEILTRLPPRPSVHLSRSASCNRINLSLPNRKPKRSLSTSGTSRPTINLRRSDRPSSTSCDKVLEPQKGKEGKRNSFPDSVIARLARQYSFSRSRRSGSSSSNMNSSPNSDGVTTVKGKSRRRTRNKDLKKDIKKLPEKNCSPNRLGVPRQKQGRIPSPINMSMMNARADGASSPDSSANSPSAFQSVFPSPPSSPNRVNGDNIISSKDSPIHGIQITHSPLSADESPIPSPPIDDKAYDSGRMSMSSFRSFGSGRPTSLSSVTSSISSRTSRGSDYFSSASSSGQSDQQHQVTSYRLGLQTVLPELNETDCADRLVIDPEGDDDQAAAKGEVASPAATDATDTTQRKNSDVTNSRAAVFDNKDLNSVDHLSPVANLAMAANPDLSYVDRVILELLETERMYVKSMKDILTGYLAVIRRNPDLRILQDDVDDVFGNIRDIYDFNRDLMLELEGCHGDPVSVATCFVSKDRDFRVYTEYCTNYPSSVAAMTRCMSNPNLADFFKVQQEELGHTLPLGSYLLKPVQRILKYHLLLQELVKHCDKQSEGYPTIQTALQTMTRVARHINEMKRKHEDAVHIQEIQSLLTNWQGNELTTYGELVMEGEMKMQGAKNERQVFLFQKMILITKRREDGYLVVKVTIECSNLVLLPNLPNNPLGFQIQPHAENVACMNLNNQPPRPSNNLLQEAPRAPQRYTLLAPSLEERNLWTYHIKKLIIDTMKVPLGAQLNIMRMQPRRVGDGDDSDDGSKPIKEKPRFGSYAVLANQETKSSKSPLARFGPNSGSNFFSGVAGGSKKSNASNSAVPQKNRRRSESSSRKNVHKRAIWRKDDIDSSDDISSDSVPTTPSNVKGAGKFSFPGFRQSTRASGTQQTQKSSTTQATTPETAQKEAEKRTNAAKNGGKTNQPEVAKRHHQSVVYRRHKRRTSQPITITEKRLSMKLPEEDEGEGNGEGEAENEEDFDDLMNFDPLTARESVSWDIQIVEAVFERYKKESSPNFSPPPRNESMSESLGSAYLTVPSDVAPSPLGALESHTPLLSQRRKSRIVVVPSDSSDEERAKTAPQSTPAVVRRKRERSGKPSYRTSGVVYTLPQEKEVESDSGINENKTHARKVAQASESVRKSMVIHESDTDAETNRILKEKAVTARRKASLKRRERNMRKRASSGNSMKASTESLTPSVTTNDGKADDTCPALEITEDPPLRRSGSFYDNVTSGDVRVKTSNVVTVTDALTNSVHRSPSGLVTSSATHSTTSVVTVRSSSFVSSASSGGRSFSHNTSNNNNTQNSDIGKQDTSTIISPGAKDTKNIPSGKVRGLIERLKNKNDPPPAPMRRLSGPVSPLKRTPMTSPSFQSAKDRFSFDLSSLQDRKSNRTATPPDHAKDQGNRDSQTNEKNLLQITEESDRPNPQRPHLLTTASLPLTITSSSSSSDGENENGPSIVERVKRLSACDSDHVIEGKENQAEAKKTPQPSLFLRRTFSHDGKSNTRRSMNLLLEARMSGDYSPENANVSEEKAFSGTADAENTTSSGKCEQVAGKSPNSGAKFDKDDSLNEAKHYLFEKLCLTTPDQTKVVDKMSEEFENVCSALETKLRYSSVDSHAFSTSDEDSLKSPRPFRRTPLLSNISGKPDERTDTHTQLPTQKPIIYQSRLSSETVPTLNKVNPYGGSVLPNRSDSIRSTRSEYRVSSRMYSGESETGRRGRSAQPRHRNSMARLPQKDIQCIPQSNVMKLTKQFSEICKESEKLVHCPPRRSKSVGMSSKFTRRLQVHNPDAKKEFSAATRQNKFSSARSISQDESKFRSSGKETSIKTTKSSERKTPETKTWKIQTATIKIDEKLTCDNTLSRSATTPKKYESKCDGNDDLDEVFADFHKQFPGKEDTKDREMTKKSTEHRRIPEVDPVKVNEIKVKKISLVEMFAANPRKSKSSEPEIVVDPGSSKDSDEEEIAREIRKVVPKENIAVENCGCDPHRQSPQVKVILVHRSDEMGGKGALEPRVLNLEGVRNPSPGEHDEKVNGKSPSPQKRHSWANKTNRATETTVRTRLRSSSLSKAKRKALFFPDPPQLKTCSDENNWEEILCQSATNAQ